MKTRLLRKLRKKASKRYKLDARWRILDGKPTTVYYISDFYKEKLIGYGPCLTERGELYTRSISRARTKLNEIRREYIQRWVADIRAKRINKVIKKL